MRITTADHLARGIPDVWREDFLAFVQTGVATDEFLEVLDHDPAAQRAVEKAFTMQSEALEAAARSLTEPHAAAAAEGGVPAISASVALALTALVELPETVRSEATKEAAATMHDQGVLPEEVRGVAADLERALASAS